MTLLSLLNYNLSCRKLHIKHISGAVAERMSLLAYIICAALYAGLVYPIPAHWIWSGGWADTAGGLDFSGASVVHISGGAAAFVGAFILGPRNKRFGTEKTSYYMANPTNVVFGTLLLCFGWIGFNCGSTFGMSNGMLN